MDDDDARERALEENRRRSQVMADAQRYGPPAPRLDGDEDHGSP